MEYIIYALAAIGLHNIWLVQNVCSIPRGWVKKTGRWGSFLLCPPCCAMWCLIGAMYLGPFIPAPIVYAFAAYPFMLIHWSLKQASHTLTKKFELYIDNKTYNERQIRVGKQEKVISSSAGGAAYASSNIVRAQDNKSGCSDCEAAKNKRAAIEEK